jgi:hypothetical protein
VETASKEGHLLQGRLHYKRKSAALAALAPILHMHEATAVVREMVPVSSALSERPSGFGLSAYRSPFLRH